MDVTWLSETSVQPSARQYQVQEDIFSKHRRESSPEDSCLPILFVSLYGEAN
jgi:hypothetical protein